MEIPLFDSQYNNMDYLSYSDFNDSLDNIYHNKIYNCENKFESPFKNGNINNKIDNLKTKPTTNELKNDNKEKINLKDKSNFTKKKRGRPGTTGNHNKFSDDNMRAKCKHLVLKNALEFINEKIKEKYNGNIGNGIFIKKLLIINQKQKSESSVQFNKNFLDKTLGDIFSENISTRYTTYPPNHNNCLIKALLNDKNEDKNDYFKRLFSLTFSNCIKHFNGIQKIEELEGMKVFDNTKTEIENDEDYLKTLEYYIMNYEDIIKNKRVRKKKVEEKNNIITCRY